MTKRVLFRHSGFVIDSDFWFRHSVFARDVRIPPRAGMFASTVTNEYGRSKWY
jgi:hypothetical protein